MSIEKTINKVRAIREGGNTERCHTTPHHGSYSVAEHGWGVATLLAILHPDPSKKLILAGMWHDVHERWLGDIPAPIKWIFDTTLQNDIKKIAVTIDTNLGIGEILDLPTEDLKWLKACDMLEFWLWSTDQQALGNCNANEGKSNAECWFDIWKNEVPEIILDIINYYRWCRTSDRYGWKL